MFQPSEGKGRTMKALRKASCPQLQEGQGYLQDVDSLSLGPIYTSLSRLYLTQSTRNDMQCLTFFALKIKNSVF